MSLASNLSLFVALIGLVVMTTPDLDANATLLRPGKVGAIAYYVVGLVFMTYYTFSGVWFSWWHPARCIRTIPAIIMVSVGWYTRGQAASAMGPVNASDERLICRTDQRAADAIRFELRPTTLLTAFCILYQFTSGIHIVHVTVSQCCVQYTGTSARWTVFAWGVLRILSPPFLIWVWQRVESDRTLGAEAATRALCTLAWILIGTSGLNIIVDDISVTSANDAWGEGYIPGLGMRMRGFVQVLAAALWLCFRAQICGTDPCHLPPRIS